MIANPDHKIIKELAVNLLSVYRHTPEEKIRVCNEMLPIAELHNGLMRPNDRPPVTVRVELDGQLWIYGANKRWRKA